MSRFFKEYWHVLKHCVKQPQWWFCVLFFMAPVIMMFFSDEETIWALWVRLAWLVGMPLFVTLYVWAEWRGRSNE